MCIRDRCNTHDHMYGNFIMLYCMGSTHMHTHTHTHTHTYTHTHSQEDYKSITVNHFH